MKIAMVALSGGMDSTAALLKIMKRGNYDVVGAHHVKLLTREGVDRVQREITACHKIFRWFTNSDMPFELTMSEYECLYDRGSGTPDIVMLAPIVTQALLAEAAKYRRDNEVTHLHLIYGDHEDEFKRGPAFTDRWTLACNLHNTIMTTVFKGSIFNGVFAPNMHNTKQEIYEYLPEDLRDLTTSCRKGRDCGNCDPCLDLEGIRERLKRE